MAHWLLRERMAEHNDDGHPERSREAHRGKQNSGDVGRSTDGPRGREDPFDREAREAPNDVRQRESPSTD
jgi:hypothetical protein